MLGERRRLARTLLTYGLAFEGLPSSVPALPPHERRITAYRRWERRFSL